METSSATARDTHRNRSLRAIGVVAVRKPSLFESSTGTGGHLFPGIVAGPTGGILRLAQSHGERSAQQARASHGHSARLSGGGYWQCSVGIRGIPVARSRFPCHQYHHPSGHDRQSSSFTPVADASPTIDWWTCRARHSPRHHSTHCQFYLRRSISCQSSRRSSFGV